MESCDPETVLINITYVHNEIGVVCPLEEVIKLKNETGAMVHVDAVQSPGKIESWDLLPQEIDFYTFSSHKFGGLKGVGFTFVSEKASSFEPLLTGGGQQEG